MSNVFALIGDMARFAQAAGPAMRLMPIIREAQQGNFAPLQAYLKEGTWSELADAIRPGAGSATRLLMEGVMNAYQQWQANVIGIDAEYRVVNEPWYDFKQWLKRQTWGAFVILGPKGQGKTQWALRLADAWHNRRGYPVEAINIYPEDLKNTPYVKPTGMKSFSRRIAALTKYLQGQIGEQPDLPDTADKKEPAYEIVDIEPMKRRVVILDEASLSIGVSGTDEGRRIARAAMAQARHLDWLVIYIGQLTRMLPMDLLGVDCVFVKKPNGREFETDRDEPIVQRLWENATEAFKQAPQTRWWTEYSDYRKWVYVDCPTMGTKDDKGYRGLIPFHMVGEQRTSEIEGNVEAT